MAVLGPGVSFEALAIVLVEAFGGHRSNELRVADDGIFFVSLKRIHSLILFHKRPNYVGPPQQALAVLKSWSVLWKLLDQHFADVGLLWYLVRWLWVGLYKLLYDELLFFDVCKSVNLPERRDTIKE